VIRLYDKKETAFRFYQTRKAKEKCLLILVMEGDKELVDLENEISQTLCRKYEGIECGEEPVLHWFSTRFNVKEASEFAPHELIFDTIEVSVTWDKSLDLYNSMISAMENIAGVIIAFAHASHFYPQGVCFYFSFGGTPVKGVEPNDFYKSVWNAAMRGCIDAGGSISHHHGIGLMRAPWLKEELGQSFETLKKLKKTLDPNNIMNPGKMGL
jgi:alkyldihydroxyacetonephosphate synthase